MSRETIPLNHNNTTTNPGQYMSIYVGILSAILTVAKLINRTIYKHTLLPYSIMFYIREKYIRQHTMGRIISPYDNSVRCF
jgi:hypothetical protein